MSGRQAQATQACRDRLPWAMSRPVLPPFLRRDGRGFGEVPQIALQALARDPPATPDPHRHHLTATDQVIELAAAHPRGDKWVIKVPLGRHVALVRLRPQADGTHRLVSCWIL